MTKNDGGRESGGDTQGRPGSGHERSGSDSRSQAAANPAAPERFCYERHRRLPDGTSCSCADEMISAHERIRALEAELAKYRGHQLRDGRCETWSKDDYDIRHHHGLHVRAEKAEAELFKQGGGRESGDGPVKSESLQEAVSSVKSGRPAAANPAARKEALR